MVQWSRTLVITQAVPETGLPVPPIYRGQATTPRYSR